MTAFDKAAAQWDLNPDRLKLHRELYDSINREVKLEKTWKALDFGCGTGIMSFMLADKLEEINALDSSNGMIEELNKKLTVEEAPDNINAHCTLLDDNTFDEESFDFLYTILTLHHVEDVEQLIKTFGKIVKSGGQIALIDLEKEDGNFHKKTETNIYHHGFEQEYIEKLLTEAGFEKITSATAATRRREMEDGSSKSYPLFLVTARKKCS